MQAHWPKDLPNKPGKKMSTNWDDENNIQEIIIKINKMQTGHIIMEESSSLQKEYNINIQPN